MTDYEIEERYLAACRNHEHEMVEQAFYDGLPHVTSPDRWRDACNKLHEAIDRPPKVSAEDDAETLLNQLFNQKLPGVGKN